MTTALPRIPPDAVLETLDRRGWTKNHWGTDNPDSPVCLYGAIRLCAPEPGDAYLIEQVQTRKGHGTTWNDDPDVTEKHVRRFVRTDLNEITVDDLADTFGPMWEPVVYLVRQAATLTPEQAHALDAARAAAMDAATVAAREATWAAAWDASRAVVTWDLATPNGPYTTAQRDLLFQPWRTVMGPNPHLPEGTNE